MNHKGLKKENRKSDEGMIYETEEQDPPTPWIPVIIKPVTVKTQKVLRIVISDQKSLIISKNLANKDRFKSSIALSQLARSAGKSIPKEEGVLYPQVAAKSYRPISIANALLQIISIFGKF